MKIALYSRQVNAIAEEDLQNFIRQISKFPFICYLHRYFYQQVKAFLPTKSNAHFETFLNTEHLKEDVELIISIGGDGTLLDVVSKCKQIPILGINFGRLGFLAVVGKENLNSVFTHLIEGTFLVEERMLLHTDISLEGEQFEGIPFALNDCVIHSNDNSSMLNVHAYLNGEYLTSYWGDGIIISTPTGSTGYSLSCGGPVIFPDMHSFLITPIAAHNLNCRPIIVSENSVVAFTVETRSKKFVCSLDSRHFELEKDTQVAIRKENFNARLVRFSDKTFLNTLKQKLHWGFDTRSHKNDL